MPAFAAPPAPPVPPAEGVVAAGAEAAAEGFLSAAGEESLPQPVRVSRAAAPVAAATVRRRWLCTGKSPRETELIERNAPTYQPYGPVEAPADTRGDGPAVPSGRGSEVLGEAVQDP